MMMAAFASSHPTISVVVNGSVVLDNAQDSRQDIRTMYDEENETSPAGGPVKILDEDARSKPRPRGVGGAISEDISAHPCVSSIRVSGIQQTIHAPGDRLKGEEGSKHHHKILVVHSNKFDSGGEQLFAPVTGTEIYVNNNNNNNSAPEPPQEQEPVCGSGGSGTIPNGGIDHHEEAQTQSACATQIQVNSNQVVSLRVGMVSGTERPDEDVRPTSNGECYFVRASVAKVVYHPEDSGCATDSLEDEPPSSEPIKLRVSFGTDSTEQNVCYMDGQTTEVATPSVSSSGCESAGEGSLMDEDEEEREMSDTGTILSRRGTIRGMRNHVRASIAALLENVGSKRHYGREENGRVVLYTTSMGVVRRTHDQCRRVRNILHTLIVRFEERDVFMNRNFQSEICDRLKLDRVIVPQLFVDGRLLGSADAIERLNETGELRRLLEPFKRDCVGKVCQLCGDFRFLPCTTCGGSKKSVQHRHQFSEDYISLRCMVCDENGLIRCHLCDLDDEQHQQH